MFGGNAPYMGSDPDGRFWWLAVAGGIGALISGGVYAATTENFTWAGFGVAAFSGLVSGVAAAGVPAAAGLSGFIGGAAGGAAGAGAGLFTTGMFDGFNNITWQTAALSIAGGAILGGAVGGITSKIQGKNFWNGKAPTVTTIPTQQPLSNADKITRADLPDVKGPRSTSLTTTDKGGSITLREPSVRVGNIERGNLGGRLPKDVTLNNVRQVPLRDLPVDAAKTYKGSIYSVEATDDIIVYSARHQFADGSVKGGQFFSLDQPTSISQVRLDKAILSKWGVANQPINVSAAYKIPAGTPFHFGLTAPQEGLRGLTNQIFIPRNVQNAFGVIQIGTPKPIF